MTENIPVGKNWKLNWLLKVLWGSSVFDEILLESSDICAGYPGLATFRGDYTFLTENDAYLADVEEEAGFLLLNAFLEENYYCN